MKSKIEIESEKILQNVKVLWPGKIFKNSFDIGKILGYDKNPFQNSKNRGEVMGFIKDKGKHVNFPRQDKAPEHFYNSCKEVDIEPTKRQYKKYLRGKGKALRGR